MKFINFSVALFAICLLFACNKSECITCKNENGMPEEIEYCDDSDMIFLDVNGDTLSFSEFQPYFESQGYDCN